MKKTLLALALVGASTSAFADAWLYGGVSAGRADYNGNSDTPMGFHVGTGILPIIGVEGGYWKHGNYDMTASNGSSGYAELGSWYAALKPSIDIGPIQLYAKGGFHYYNADYKGNLNGSDSGTDFMYGVGAEYFVTDMLSVGASWQRFNGIKTSFSNDKDLDSFTINATLHIF
ncbi:porin family protein [Vibrio maritimus]|jgi:opacity protein-like surface antigen|uniref:porin family protein n=1 Tax=Vibrio TaxID=662 RepID=UPI003AB11BF8